MKKNGCFVVWPHTRTDELTVHCIINASQSDAFTRLRNWSQRSRSLLEEQLSAFRFSNDQVLHEIWTQVRYVSSGGAVVRLYCYGDFDNADF